ncbi:MAG: hypothetical protein COA43_01695 [Robiginitomaculum sp.]|nr:MAG: hypothetical protein COA43_01695 [Robiginitomaculum sp.]
MRIALICTTILILTACGDEQSDQSADTSNLSVNSPVTALLDRKSRGSALTNTPISFADATGETSKMIEVGPCPFVSDETIKASVRTTFEITRREVSNTECRWAYNAGFVINVTIEDIVTAKPVSERRYNIGVDTVSTPQDGPGTHAAMINDTAWGKLMPFAYSFEKDGKLVFIRYTGFKTGADIMRPAANEIAARMSTAPTIRHQRRHKTEPFKACDVWSEHDLKTVFGASETAVVAPGARSMSTCSWKIYEDGVSGQRTAAFNFYKREAGKKQEHEYDSYKPYSADGETHYLRKSNSSFGTYIHIITPRPEGLVHVTVSDPEKDPSAIAKVLQKNLLSRMVP